MSIYVWAWICCVGLGAGWVRGFAGFGFSVLCMAALSWIISPSLVVPVVVVLEMSASVVMWRGSVASADRDWLRALVLGNLIAVPVGMGLLLFLPQYPLRVLLAVLLFVAALTLRFVLRTELKNTEALRRLCGIVSGLMNGIAASGGVVPALVMAASGLPGARLRATMVLFLLIADAYMMVCMLLATHLGLPVTNTLVDQHTFTLVLALGLPMVLGIYIGQRHFHQTATLDFRAFVLNLLMLMAALSLVLTLAR